MLSFTRTSAAIAITTSATVLIGLGGDPVAGGSADGPSTVDVLAPTASLKTATRVTPPTPEPVTPPPPPADEAPVPPPESGAVASPEAVALTNQQREAAGLSALATSGALIDAAEQHSTDQAERDAMGHTGSDGSNAGARIIANGGGFQRWAENVAAGHPNAASVVDGWMDSPGHRENILDPSMTQIGVAVDTAADGTPYWTMVLSG